MKTLKIHDIESYSENIELINKFRDDLYYPNFPNENEREPFENIRNRIIYGLYPKTFILLMVSDSDLLGGCVYDFYLECNSIEPIYLVVNEVYRKSGIGRSLLNEIEESHNFPKMFLEVDNPSIVDSKDSAMDPLIRLEIYKKLGFRVINIDYVQPPLSEGLDYERNLLLLFKGDNLEKIDLIKFLKYFYKGLKYESSPELDAMIYQISKLNNVLI